MLRRKLFSCCILVLCGVLFASSVSAADSKRLGVAVSIKPLHSLVAGLMAGAGEPSLIVKGARSPHTYSLKPSDARNLSQADIVIWSGPGLEMFLEKPIKALAGDATVLTLNEDISADPHLWLSPELAASLVERVLTSLIRADPGNSELYRTNARTLSKRLATLHQDGLRRLRPLREKPFIVFHDAWGHFATAFDLSVAGAVALSPERSPGAKRITSINRLIGKSAARCLFSEPQFQSALLSAVLDGHEDIRVSELDPLGSKIPPGPQLYFQMMRENIDAVAVCLQ